MAIDIRKALLAGTALVAVSFAATPAHALDADGNQIWANGSSGSLMSANASDDLNVDGFTVTVTNDGSANDGGGYNDFTIGSVTDTGSGSILVTTGQSSTLNADFSNVGINGDFSVVGDDADNASIYAAINGTLYTGTLNVTSDETDSSQSVNLSVSGLAHVTGAATVSGGNILGADSYLFLGNDAYFDSGLVLQDGVGGGQAHLVLDGSGTTDIYGNIDADGNAQGIVTIHTSGDTHFHNAVGGASYLSRIELDTSQTTTFHNTVDAAEIIFNGSATVVFADDVNMSSAGVIDFNYYGGSVYFNNGGDSTIYLGGNIIDSSNSGYGTVNIVNGNNVVTYASIGTLGNYIGNLTIGYDASTASDVTTLQITQGDVYASSLDMWGAATLTLSGGSTQTISATVHGNKYSNIVVANTSANGVIFEGSISGGTVTIDAAANNATATFQNTVSADEIVLGGDGNSGDLNQAIFDGSFTVSSDISGANADEDNDLVVAGGSDIVFSGDLGANLNAISIGSSAPYSYTYAEFQGNVASGSILLFGGAGTSNYVTFNTGKTIDIDATVYGISSSGTNDITISGGGTVNQNAEWVSNLDDLYINDSTLVANENMKFTSNLRLYGDNAVLTVAGGTTQANNIEFYGEDSTINLDGGNLKGDVFGYYNGYGHLNVLQNAQIDGNLYTLGTLALSANLEVTGDAYAADVTDIGTNTLTVGGDFTLGAGQELDVALASATTSGQVVVTGNAFVDEDAKIVVTTSKAWTIADGTKFVIIDANDAGTGVSDIGTNLDVTSLNTAIVDFTFEQDTDDLGNFVLVAHTAAVTGGLTGLSQPATAAGNALQEAALTSSDPAISDLMDALDTALLASDTAEAERLLTSIAPTVDGGAAQASVSSFGQQVQHIAQNRLFNLLHGGGLDQIALNGLSGMAAGASTNGIGFWVQGFGQSAQQDARDMIAGYDADSAGMSAGIDTSNVIRNGILGVSFSYGNTNANSKNSNQTGIDINSYGVNVYASKVLGAGYFLNGQVGYAYNDIDSVRHNVGLGGTAAASYKSDLYSAQIGGGKDYAVGNGLTLTPSLMASYLHLATGGYTETGTGAPLLTVGSENSDSLRLGIGMTAMWNLKNDNGAKLRPALSVGYAYDALADNIESTAQFVGGGPAFKSLGARPARNEFNAGAALTYVTPANWDLSASYDYTYKEDFDAHTGVVRATIHF